MSTNDDICLIHITNKLTYPISHSTKSNANPSLSATACNTGNVASMISGPIPSPFNKVIVYLSFLLTAIDRMDVLRFDECKVKASVDTIRIINNIKAIIFDVNLPDESYCLSEKKVRII